MTTTRRFRPSGIRGITTMLLLAAALLLLASFPRSSQAQTGSSPAYWRYDAFGQIDQLLQADVNNDGMDEFVILAEANKVALVTSDGREVWSFESPEPVLQMVALNIHGQDAPQKEILLNTGGELILLSSQGSVIWQKATDNPVQEIAAFDPDGQGHESILAASAPNRLQRFDGSGELVWDYSGGGEEIEGITPKVTVGNVDGEAGEEILFGYFVDPGFSEIVLLDDDKTELWDGAASGHITALLPVQFEEGETQFAVATLLRNDRTFIYLLDGGTGAERWYRTPNKEVTSLGFGYLEGEPALLLGTNAGTVIAYDQRGKRYWSHNFSDTPDRAVLGIDLNPASKTGTYPDAVAITLAPDRGESGAEVLLLNNDGQILETFRSASTTGSTRLSDINGDSNAELVLVRFATMELLDPGIGTRQNLPGWSIAINAQPHSALVADLNGDRVDEVLVGGSNGRLNVIENSGSGEPTSTVMNLGGIVSHLALIENIGDPTPDIVAASNIPQVGADQLERFSGKLTVLSMRGRVVWEKELNTAVTSLLVADLDREGRPVVIVGTSDGQLLAYEQDGTLRWGTVINGSVVLLALLELESVELVAASSTGALLKINASGTGIQPVATFLSDVTALQPVPQGGQFQAQLFLTVDDGTIRWLDWRGIQLSGWQRNTNGVPILVKDIGDSFLVATDAERLIRLDYENQQIWQLQNMGRIRSLYVGDLDGDVQADVAVGTREGEVRLFALDGGDPWDSLTLSSGIFLVSALHGPDGQQQLITVSDNGVVQQFQPQPNRAPLLVRPTTVADQEQYSVSILVNDRERDRVLVDLSVRHPETGQWLPQVQRSIDGEGELFWSVDPALAVNGLEYRFSFQAGSHSGEIGPLTGVHALPPVSGQLPAGGVLLAAFVFAAAGVLAFRYTQSVPAQARRFNQRLRNNPLLALDLLAEEYQRHGGSPEFLLTLANQARQGNDRLLAAVTDGLFLLKERPDAALEVLSDALEAAAQEDRPWRNLDLWLANCQQGHVLLEAPSITELSLLRPQLAELLNQQQRRDENIISYEWMLPIVTALRDSERVDLADDRLVYLNEALALIWSVRDRLKLLPTRISTEIVAAIVNRWESLINVAIEELRGQAALTVTLRTRHLAPQQSGIEVALDIENKGRSSAEDVSIKLAGDPAYKANGAAAFIRVLPPGHKRRVTLPIQPLVTDRFRAVFEIVYSDRHQVGKTMAFGDMVHLLAPQREFTSIRNPYLPGTPLRRHSDLFFGRSNLFQFVSDNASKKHQRNVLILVGQRRTGKTSALLRLEQHLPQYVLPVYVDCQSFGVTPGIPAMLHDISWFISDALAIRGITLDVPSPEEWQIDPTGKFQRELIPRALSMLPEDGVMLLVFDEFEALENLVNDGILPHTLFPYLRHLMQHVDGLGFIFAGTRQLEEMSTDYWSVLFNIALYRQVGFLDTESAVRLITEPVAPNIVYDDLALDKILRVTAGHPYFLQLVCYTLVNRANREQTGYVTINDVNAALDEMLRLGEAHFAYLWHRSSHTERALLTAVAHLMDGDLPFRPADLQQYLAEYGVHLTPAQVTTALNKLVEREIMQEVSGEATTRYELRIGLVGLWVAQNKSLSKLYEEKLVRPVAT